MLAYDLERDKDGNIIDVIVMQSGSVGSSVRTKISRQPLTLSNGVKRIFSLYYLYFNEKLNSDFDEILNEGNVGLVRLSKFVRWVNINNINRREPEYAILRFVNSDSKGNAIFNCNYNNQNTFPNKEIIKLTDKSIDRYKFKHLYI